MADQPYPNERFCSSGVRHSFSYTRKPGRDNAALQNIYDCDRCGYTIGKEALKESSDYA
jgi:hypothetical protein